MAGPVNSDGPIVMWTIGQIATRDKVSKPAVSKMVAKLVREHDLPVQRDARQRVVAVSIADYDHHRAWFGSSAQDQTDRADLTPPSPGPDLPASPSESRDEALRQKAWMEVRRQKLEDAKEAGRLVRADLLVEAVATVGRIIQSEVGRLTNRADDVALAVSKEGTSGARAELRKAAVDINTRIADALDRIVADLPETDAALEDAEE